MGTGICSCNGPCDNKNEKDLEEALREEQIRPYQTKGAITKKDGTTVKNETIKSANIIEQKEESASHSQSDNNDIKPPNELVKKFTLIPQLKDDSITSDDDYKEIDTSVESSDNASQNEMAKLCVCSRNEQIMSMLFEDEYYNVENCTVLDILYSDITVIHENMDKFTNLHHLEIFKPQINGQRKLYTEVYNVINKILDGTSVNLVSFKFIASIQHVYSKKKSQTFPALNIPSTMEWLTLGNIGCNVNISNCDMLIGLQLLNNMTYEQIIWPDCLIPFVAVCDGNDIDDCEWHDKCEHEEFNVKYVCLLKESFIDGTIRYNDNEMIEKFEIDFNEYDDNRKCVILNESELSGGELYSKIMRYKFRNKIKLKSEKMLIHDDCVWIKQIGNVKYY